MLRCVTCGHITNRNYDARRHALRCGPTHLSSKVSVVNPWYKSPGEAMKYSFPPPSQGVEGHVEAVAREGLYVYCMD